MICLWGWVTLAVPGTFAQGFQRLVLTADVPTAVSVTVADFDGDGDRDAAATGIQNLAVTWLETAGSGSIAHTAYLAVTVGPRGITSGDFDSDGDADIVVASYGEGQLVLLENVGGGGEDQFESRVLFGPARGAWSVRTGDVDGDGDDDLATTDYQGNVVRLFVQDAGELTQATAHSITNPMDARLADVDGDGDVDVIGSSYPQGLFWVEHTTAAWQFHLLQLGNGITSVAPGDLDADGDVDLLTTSFADNQVAWWERSGTSYVPHVLVSGLVQPRDAAIADFDLDLDPDLVISTQLGILRWWQNAGGGVFGMRQTPEGGSLYGLAVADWDFDGDADVLAANYLGGELVLFRNTMGVPGLVRGIVRAELDDAPVAGIHVQLIESGAATVTDASGLYRIFSAPGTFTLRASHPCWNTELYAPVTIVRSESTQVDLALTRPLLEVSVTSLNLVVHQDEPMEAQIPVTNPGDGPLMLTAQVRTNMPDADWLAVEPDSAVLAPGGSLDFMAQVHADGGDDLWDYYGVIELRSDACPDSFVQVAVLAFVLDAPEREPGPPETTALLPPSPNPFNAATTIRFDLARPGRVSLVLYDIQGRVARRIAEQDFAGGRHRLTLAADDLASGVYLLALRTAGATYSQKLLLLK